MNNDLNRPLMILSCHNDVCDYDVCVCVLIAILNILIFKLCISYIS